MNRARFANNESSKTPNKNRKKWTAVIAAAAFALLVTASIIFAVNRKNAAPPRTPEETAVMEFKKAIAGEPAMLGKLYHLRKMLGASKKLPPDERRKMLIRAASGGVVSVMEDFSTLPEKDKEKQAKILCSDARNMHQAFRRLSPVNRKRALSIFENDPEAKENFNRAVHYAADRLTPADRVRLAPTLALWQKILDNKP